MLGFAEDWTVSLLGAKMDVGKDNVGDGAGRASMLQIVQDTEDLAKKALGVQVLEAQIAGIRRGHTVVLSSYLCHYIFLCI